MNRLILRPTHVAAALLLFVMLITTIAAGSAIPGVYKGHEITVTLSGDGSHITGTIDMAGNKLPLTADDRGKGQIVGTFTSDGDQFDFTATLDGDMLSLTSDSTTYILMRQASASNNPLDRGHTNAAQPSPAKPANPLDRAGNGSGACALHRHLPRPRQCLQLDEVHQDLRSRSGHQ